MGWLTRGSSQPTLESLWPNRDGTRWDYRISSTNAPDPSRNFTADAMLQLTGTAETAGGQAQVLVASHGLAPKPGAVGGLDPLLRAIWRARPDLRPAIEARYGKPSGDRIWWPSSPSGGSHVLREEAPRAEPSPAR